MKSSENLRTVRCPNCRLGKTILLEDPVGLCPNCQSIMAEDPNTEHKEKHKKKLDILNEAFNIISGERQDSYGKPEDSFEIIASLWMVYLKHKFDVNYLEIEPVDVAHMMTLFKIARMLGQKPDRDNYRDAIGYLAIAAERLIRWPEPFDPEEL